MGRPAAAGSIALAPAIDHEHAVQMAQVGLILDQHPQLERLVDQDLVATRTRRDRGRAGMTADQVLRALLVKQMNQYSYDELAFALADSATYRAFCRLQGWRRSRSFLERRK